MPEDAFRAVPRKISVAVGALHDVHVSTLVPRSLLEQSPIWGTLRGCLDDAPSGRAPASR
jgi:hypothetical protein